MACPDGQYFCHDRGKCMPIPKGHKVRKDGELVKEAVKGQDTASRREGAKERTAEKKSGKIRQNTLSPKDYATQQKKSIEWHDKRTKGRYIPGQISDVNEVAPPGWGHTKAEKEKTKPNKPKSKIGGTAAAFKRALDDGRFKGLPGDKTKKEKTASMFKLMWSMKKKGDKPHYKPGTDEKYKKYQKEDTAMPNISTKDKKVINSREKRLFKKEYDRDINETMSGKDAKKLEKASVLSYSDNPKDQDRARARQVDVDYKDLLRQLKAKKKKKYNESFEIDPSGHKKVQKKAKIRNLARGNKNPNEKAAAEKKLGPKLFGEGRTFKDWRKAASSAFKKKVKKHEYPAGASGGDAGKKAKERLDQRERETYVSPFKPVDYD